MHSYVDKIEDYRNRGTMKRKAFSSGEWGPLAVDEVKEPNYKKPHPSRPSHKMLGRSTFSIGEGFGERSLVWVADGSSICANNDL